MAQDLASVDDVKDILRVSGLSELEEARIRRSLSAIQAWAEENLRPVCEEGDAVQSYWDIYEDATLLLPSEDVLVTKVKVYDYPSSSGVPLSPIELGLGHGYDITENGRLILRPTLGFSPFEGATAQRPLRIYSRVEVFYRGTGVIPRTMTEGVAWLAAGYYQFGPQVLEGIKKEKIGDYAYESDIPKGSDGQPAYITQAAFFLNRHMRKAGRKVSVI